MLLSRNGSPVEMYTPEYVGQNIYIGIDSSKSNTAIVVGNEYREIIADYEINGAGNEVDVYQLCWDTRKQLKSLFSGANIQAVAIEDIITKKSDNNFKGMDVHNSRAKITAVFDNLIFTFQEYFEITPRRINNQEWKANTLPEEYRKRDHKKGSKDYFNDIGGRWSGRKDDVTDAVCILTYLYSLVNLRLITKIHEVMPTSKSYNYGIYPITMSMPTESKEFEINTKHSIRQNMDTMVEKLNQRDTYAYAQVDLEYVPIEWLYNGTFKKAYPKGVTKVLLVVKRKET